MATTLTYGTYSFIPVPDIAISTEIQRSDAGYGVGTVDKITLNGVLYASGSEINQSGTPKNKSSINNLMVQLSGLQAAVQQDYQQLLLRCSTDIYRSEKGKTVVDSFSFENSSDEQWLQVINYTINLSVYSTGFINYITDSGYLVSNFTNTYNISTNDDNAYYNGSQFRPIGLNFPSYTITREVSAQGIQTETVSALDNAMKCVSGLTNNSNIAFSNILSGLYIYDRSTEISKDPINGSYSIRDTFAAYSGSSGWTDTYTITSSIDNGLQRTVDIAGQVQGFASYPLSTSLYTKTIDDSFSTDTTWQGYGSTKWLAASGGFFTHVKPQILNRALSAWMNNTGLYKAIIESGKLPFNTGLNPLPVNISVDHDISQGSISYNYSFNSRPLAMITGALSESIDMEDDYAIRTYVFPDIYFRLPLAQDKGTYTNSKRSITYNASFPRPFSPTGITAALKTRINQVINEFNPSGLALRSTNPRGPAFFSWVVESNENFDVLGGRYTKRITWEYQKAYI
jgi:hypothetical protein